MQAHIKYVITVFLITFATSSVHAEDLKCEYEERFEDGGSKGAVARLTVEEGRIIALGIYSIVSSGREGGGYVCGIDTSEQGQKIVWSVKDAKTILEVELDPPLDLPKYKSVIEIDENGVTYKINLEGASIHMCGFGAEWPKSIVIEKGKEECRVLY